MSLAEIQRKIQLREDEILRSRNLIATLTDISERQSGELLELRHHGSPEIIDDAKVKITQLEEMNASQSIETYESQLTVSKIFCS